jgi:hypothetical protein
MNDGPIHERLRQILREGDPATQDAGLTPDEIHATRRTVLTAIPESRRRLGWLPLGIAGFAGTAALILLVLGPWHRPATVPRVPQAAPRMATVATPAPAPSEAPEPAVPSERPVKSPKPAQRRAVRPSQPPPANHDELMTMASLPETPASPVREIRFSTPGGTRIIWELSAGAVR